MRDVYSLALFTHDKDFEGILGLHTVTASPVSRAVVQTTTANCRLMTHHSRPSFAKSICLLQ
jgi:hypothetical protein